MAKIRLESEAAKGVHVAAERHDMAFIVGAVIGSVAGAAYGLLNAPQAGWRTRADLSGYAEEMGDRFASRVAAATVEVRSLIGEDPGDPDVLPPELGDTLSPVSVSIQTSPNPARSEGATAR